MFQKPLEGRRQVPFTSGTQEFVFPVTKQLALLGCPGLVILAYGEGKQSRREKRGNPKFSICEREDPGEKKKENKTQACCVLCGRTR